MQKLRFFDCNCSVGRTGYPHLLDISDAAGLRREMEIAGIEEALAYHTVARDGHPPLGNALLHEEIKGQAGLYPVWVLLPPQTGEMPLPEKLIPEMKTQGVKAARLYPGRSHHSFSLADWSAGGLLARLEGARLPVILDIEIVTWEEVFTLLSTHPLLPLVISNCSYRHNRFLYPLWEKFENLFVEISRFMGAGALEDVVKRFGAGRLLFGTNMPQYSGTAAVALVAYAEISREEKEAIAGGNLKNIMKGMWQ